MYDSKNAHPIFIFALIALFFAYLGLENYTYELTSRESILGNITRYSATHGLFENSMLGEQEKRAPFFTWISLFLGAGQVNQFTLRLVSLFSLLGIGIMAFFSARRFGGNKSAWPALIFSLSSVATINLATEAEEGLLTAFLMSCAWMSWYGISRKSKRWFKAWFWGVFFTSLAAAVTGPYVYLFFYLPMLLMTRPTDVRKRLVMLPHLSALSFNIIIIIAFQYLFTNFASSRELSFNFFSTDVTPPSKPDFEFDKGYIKDSAQFGINAISYFMPWALFAWTGFCEAFRLIEKNSLAGPEIFRFLRRICCVLFFSFMFYPDTNAYSLIPLIYPLSVMTALHYPILERRHGELFIKIIRILKLLLIPALVAPLYIIYTKWNSDLNAYQLKHLNAALVLSSCAFILLALSFFKFFKRHAPWLQFSFLTLFIFMGIASARHLRFERFEYSALATANTISSAVNDQNTVIYNFSGKELRKELFYLSNESIPVVDSLAPEELPDRLYVIGTDSKPVRICTDSVRYKWQNISEEITIKEGKIVVYYGEVVIDQTPSPSGN